MPLELPDFVLKINRLFQHHAAEQRNAEAETLALAAEDKGQIETL